MVAPFARPGHRLRLGLDEHPATAKQSRVELPLVLSDHADWRELTATIPATGAEEIWITHGREDALQHWCESQGLFAKPLSLHGREEEAGE